METLKCMIVDDELMARKSLERLCKKLPFLKIEAICENGKVALKTISEKEIDLIFLDVEMPELSGIDFLEAATVLPQIIFITSRTEYAYDAFQYNVTDYLKKPITLPRFKIAVEKAKEIHLSQQKTVEVGNKEKAVFVRTEGRLVRLAYEDILYFENVGDYIRVKTIQKSYIIHGSLKGIYKKLNPIQFLKVHRSYIVNLDKIKDIEEHSLLIAEKLIPISRANKPILLNRLNTL